MKQVWEQMRELIVPSLWVLPIALYLFVLVWQSSEKNRLVRSIRNLHLSKKEMIRANDEIKIGIVTYTSAERIEALYRKTYQFLPVNMSTRIVTVELPKENLKGSPEP